MDSREYIIDRFKKLTSAVYRVTDLLSDREPLKWTLRDKAIDIFNSFLKDNKVEMSDIINILDLFLNESSISSLNYDVLKKEYKNLMSFIEDNKKNIIPEQKIVFDIGQIIPEQRPREKAIKTLAHNNGSRKEKILDILKDHGSKTISEIAPFFHEVSEKSIQRDLIDLVKTGSVEAEGEKRWRKYKILTNVSI